MRSSLTRETMQCSRLRRLDKMFDLRYLRCSGLPSPVKGSPRMSRNAGSKKAKGPSPLPFRRKAGGNGL